MKPPNCADHPIFLDPAGRFILQGRVFLAFRIFAKWVRGKYKSRFGQMLGREIIESPKVSIQEETGEKLSTMCEFE